MSPTVLGVVGPGFLVRFLHYALLWGCWVYRVHVLLKGTEGVAIGEYMVPEPAPDPRQDKGVDLEFSVRAWRLGVTLRLHAAAADADAADDADNDDKDDDIEDKDDTDDANHWKENANQDDGKGGGNDIGYGDDNDDGDDDDDNGDEDDDHDADGRHAAYDGDDGEDDDHKDDEDDDHDVDDDDDDMMRTTL